jgi:hypothetical protein
MVATALGIGVKPNGVTALPGVPNAGKVGVTNRGGKVVVAWTAGEAAMAVWVCCMANCVETSCAACVKTAFKSCVGVALLFDPQAPATIAVRREIANNLNLTETSIDCLTGYYSTTTIFTQRKVPK